MADNARVCITSPAGTFPYKIIEGEMAQKWLKNVIFGPKMLQITYNLDIWCILMILNDFQKNFNFYQKLPDFWAKNTRFFADAAKICRRGKNLGKNFSTESVCVFSKTVQLTQFLIEMFLRVPSRTSNGLFFYILSFSLFMGSNSRQNSLF